jgi:type IV pilus assembly protein PilC
MKDLALFTRQLAAMLRGGLPLVESLNQLEQVFPHKGYKRAAGELGLGLTLGYGFSQQLVNFSRLFPVFYRAVAQIGETGDSLLPALDTLAEYYSDREKIKNRLLRIMFYPLLLIGVALGSGIIALWYVVPGFSSLYGVLGTEIPAATRLVFTAAKAVTPTRLLAAAIILAALLGTAVWLFAKRVQWRTLAKVPLAGTLYCYWFCKVTAMIASAGHTLEQALSMAAAVSRRGPAPAALTAIREGSSLYSALEGSPGVLRSFVAQGERTGELPVALTKAAEYYGQRLEESMDNFQRLLEPLSVLIVGGMVAAMLLVLMLPVLQLARVF